MYWGLLSYPCQDHKPQVTEMYPHINQLSILNPYHFSITRVHKLQNNSWTVIQCCSSLLDSSFSTSVNNVFLPLSGAGRHTETAAATAKLFQSCPTLYDLIDGSPPGSSVPGMLQGRTLEWVSPGKNTGVGCHVLLQCMKVKSESEFSQSCPTLSNPMDCNLPGSSTHEILQARILEWVTIAFSDTETRLLLIFSKEE